MADDPHLEQLLQTCVRFLESEGVPRLGGRMFGVILLAGEALSLDELAERAGASKASASSNARLLERLGLVEKASPAGERKDLYRLAPAGVVAPLKLVWARIGQLRDMYALASRSESSAAPAVRNRLRLDLSFLEHLLETDRDLARQWQERTRRFEDSVSAGDPAR